MTSIPYSVSISMPPRSSITFVPPATIAITFCTLSERWHLGQTICWLLAILKFQSLFVFYVILRMYQWYATWLATNRDIAILVSGWIGHGLKVVFVTTF